MDTPEPEFWIERLDGSIMRPSEIKTAAESISKEGESSPYYAEFKNFMDYGGDYDVANNTPGDTFGQALEDGYGLMHIKWGDGREYTARIVGMNHDDKSDGSGKAGLTFQFTGLLYDYQRFNPINSNTGGWRSSELRFRMNPDELVDDSVLMENAETDHGIWDAAPLQLQNSIVAVDKSTKNRDDGTTTNTDLETILATTTSDKLWIMSLSEIVEIYFSNYKGLNGEGSQYEYWNGKVTNDLDNYSLKKFPAKYSPTSAQPSFEGDWWERSVNPAYATSYLAVGSANYSGNPYDAEAAGDYWRVCPCFCL